MGELGEGSQAFDVLREPNGRLVVAGIVLANEAIAAVPAGAMCGARPCWRRLPTGFDYRDGARAEGGLARIQLRPGADGPARVLLDASGPALDVPRLPLEAPVTVELRTTSDVCWQGVYGAGGVRRNDAGSFVGRGTLE